MRKKVEKWIDLSRLPRKYGVGANKDKQVIDWDECANQEYKIKFIYDGTEDEIEILNYNSTDAKLNIKIKNKKFEINTGNFIKCQFGLILGKFTPDFKVEIGTIFKDDKRDIIITDRKYIKDKRNQNLKYYKYKCNTCTYICGEYYMNGKSGEEYWILEGNLLKGTGCACCSNKITVPHINSIVANEETHWMISYFQGGYEEAKKYAPQSSVKLKFKCPDCGRVKDKSLTICSIYRNHSVSCSCNDGKSYSEKFMFNMLEQLNLEFETEYSPEWIKPRRYDFYIPNKTIIEMDGIQHKKEKFYNISKITLKEQLAIDNYKDKIAEEHGIKVIRIDCEFSDLEFIKKDILLKLSDIFDLSNIDWDECGRYAMTNLKKEVCEYWKNKKPYETIKDLSVFFNIGKTSILNYLHQGTKLCWCEYDGKTETGKSSRKSGKMNGKPVEIFKDGISLGILPSCAELSRQSLDLFGVKLDQTLISWVAIGKRNHHHGYTFRYVDKVTKSDKEHSQTQSA